MVKVTDLKFEIDGSWDWEGKAFIYIPTPGYGRSEVVDPTPGYSHDVEIVKVEAEKCWKACPLDRDLQIFILDRDIPARTNGQTSTTTDYDKPKEASGRYPWCPYITLSGKRIPPHPAMTRYLVAHEYGHAVQHVVNCKRGHELSSEKLYDEYKKIRAVPTGRYYGPGNWHARIEELFANDFRILVMGCEKEFWPHPGFQRPESVHGLEDWWKQVVELCASKEPSKESSSSG